MAEATCRRELELEIPAEEVTKRWRAWAKEFAAAGETCRDSARQGARIADPAKFAKTLRRSAAIAGAGAR